MKREELKIFLNEKLKNISKLAIVQYIKSKKYINVYNEIINITNYLPENCKFTERIYNILNNIIERKKCICGNYLSFRNMSYGYSIFCSDKCFFSSLTDEKIKEINERAVITRIRKYGTSNNRKKAEETCLKKYGEKSVLSVKKIREKIENTKIKKYNDKYYTNPNQKSKTWENKSNDEKNKIILKRQDTIVKKYSNFYKDIVKKRNITFFNKLLNSNRLNEKVIPLFDVNEYNGHTKKYKWKCLICNNEFEDNIKMGKVPRCDKCYPIKNKSTSIFEIDIFNFINNKEEIKMEKNKHFSRKYELDIFIPSKNIGIEFNGLYWHSEINGKKDRNYHLNKSNFFKERGIKIIHIFEDEWIEKQEIVKSIILSKLGLIKEKIYGRNTEIRIVNRNDSELFLFDNHIQGFINSKVNIGLYYNNELVSLMSFGKSRFNKNYDWELTRFCNKINTNVIGGASKLLNYFKNNYKGSIISYADLRYSDGNLYEKLGFKLLGMSKPNYYYLLMDKKRYSRIEFQKHKLKDKLKIFDENLTEWQNMQLNGYDRIWDCGNLVYINK